METIKVFTAFSGYDSQCLALKRIGVPFDLVGFSEIDKYAIQAHNVLFPEYTDRNYGDISKIDWDNVPDFDLFTYSYPCTNISNAGKQEGFDEGSGTSSSLLWECRKAIVAKKPKYLLMENVKALLSAKFKPLFMKWQNELASYGYANFIKVLDAQDYGVPQHRERVFMVSILDDNASFHFPEPFPLERKLKDVLEKEVDEMYYLSDRTLNFFLRNSENMKSKGCGFSFKPTVGHGIANSITTKSGSRMDDNYIIVRGNLYNDNKQAGRIYDADGIAPTLDNMASGGNTDCLVFEPKQVIGYTQKCAYRGDVDGVSPTITAACGMGGGQTPMILGVTVNPNRTFEFNNGRIHQDTCHTLTAQDAKNTSVVWERGFRIRKLTPREVFRLMDVDEADIDKLLNSGISNTQLYKMAGNSICTSVLYHIFRKLFVEKENENKQLTLF